MNYLKKTMKTFYICFSLALILVSGESCSRRLSATHSISKLQTISAPGNNKPGITGSAYKPTDDIVLNASPEINCSYGLSPALMLKAGTIKRKAVKNEVRTIKSLASKEVSDLTIAHKHISERGYPQINKAGFIFIAAAILGYFLHLILIACIIIGVIGLIVLLSPLLRKRY